MHQIRVDASEAGRRLDRFLFAYLPAAPQPLMYKLLRKKRIKLNGGRADGAEMLTAGDTLGFYIAPETLAGWRGARTVAPAAPVPEIVYEDAEMIIFNKPAGLAAHGGMDSGDHLQARLLYYLYQKGEYDPQANYSPALCNRLDVNTSGLTVCGKTLAALQTWNARFAQRTITKEYLAIVDGPLRGEATLTGFYEKDTRRNIARIIPGLTRTAPDLAAGQVITHTSSDLAGQVITHYKSLAVGERHTLLCVTLVTGRSHQIRAHLAGIGHPIAGDTKYGGKPITRTLMPPEYLPGDIQAETTPPQAPAQLLHAHRLTIVDGTCWTAEPPAYFALAMTALKPADI